MQRAARLAAAASQILGHCKAQANPHGLVYPAARLKGGAMARLLLGLGLIALPFVELALLVKTGQTIGLWPTLGCWWARRCSAGQLCRAKASLSPAGRKKQWRAAARRWAPCSMAR